jgi:hypothetical protein
MKKPINILLHRAFPLIDQNDSLNNTFIRVDPI